MASQVSQIPCGNANVVAGYIACPNNQLGSFDLAFTNTGTNTATIIIKQLSADGTAYNITLVNSFTIVAGGTLTKHLVGIGVGQVALFASGNTVVNMEIIIRNPAALAGQDIFFTTTGRRGWGASTAVDPSGFRYWGTNLDLPSAPPENPFGYRA